MPPQGTLQETQEESSQHRYGRKRTTTITMIMMQDSIKFASKKSDEQRCKRSSDSVDHIARDHVVSRSMRSMATKSVHAVEPSPATGEATRTKSRRPGTFVSSRNVPSGGTSQAEAMLASSRQSTCSNRSRRKEKQRERSRVVQERSRRPGMFQAEERRKRRQC